MGDAGPNSLSRAIAVTAAAALCAVGIAHDNVPPVVRELPQDARGAPRRPTYHKHVAKILRKHCITCHRDGEIAPFALDTYSEARFWIDGALEQIALGRMPPWRPTRGVGAFEGERGLSDREIATLVRWHDRGAREGRTPRKAPPRPETPEWPLGTPDAVLSYPLPYDVPQGDDVYRCFPLQTDFGRDVYLRGLDVRPGDRRIVHHVVLFLDPEGESHGLDDDEPGPGYTCFGGPGLSQYEQLLGGGTVDLSEGLPPSPVVGGWAPGNRPSFLPEGTGLRIPAGATIVMQVHYHPLAGLDIADQTEFGMYVTDDPDTREVLLAPLVDMEFTIPAGDPAYVVEVTEDPSALIRQATGLDIGIAAEVLGVLPHMHLLGRQIEVDADLPDGTSQRLVEIRDWSFDWQDTYYFERPLPLPEGSTLRLRCVFDNSAANPLNPNVPPQAVSWGERTVDEMALAFVVIAPQFPDLVLDLLGLLGAPLPHPRGLPPVVAADPPLVRRAWIDGRGRLNVRTRRLRGGGRIELDGVPLDDSMRRKRVGRLRSTADWEPLIPADTTVEIRVRRGDGRLSEPVAFRRD